MRVRTKVCPKCGCSDNYTSSELVGYRCHNCGSMSPLYTETKPWWKRLLLRRAA